MRLFLAAFPSRAAQATAAGVIEQLRKPGDGVSWVKAENLHYTLRFLGEVGEDGAKRAEQAAHEAAKSAAAFGARLGPPGAFPSAKRARVIWLGLLEGAEPFARLAVALERELERKGFEPEGREFAPHLTLGRVRAPGRDWTADLLAAEAPPDEAAARFPIAAIAVVESRLSPRVSTYTVRAEAPLAG